MGPVGERTKERNGIPAATAIEAVADKYRRSFIDCRRDVADLAALDRFTQQALAGELDFRAFELALIRLDRTAPPLTFQPKHRARQEMYKFSSGDSTRDTLAAALCLGAGHSEDGLVKGYGEQIVEAARRPELRNIGLHGVMRMVLESNGKRAPAGKFSDSDISDVLRLSASVGPSTLSLSGILGDFTRRSLLASYDEVPVTWKKFCRVGPPLPDFRTHERYRLLPKGQIQQIAKGGELIHLSLQDATFKQQADLYGGLLGLDYRDLKNDDLGALATVPKVLGRQCAIHLEKAVYTLLVSNPGGTTSGFFSTANGNYDDGADTLLDLTGIANANNLFRARVDANNDPAFITPKLVLCPPSLAPQAWTILMSPQVITGEGTTMANLNPWSGMFGLESSPYLAATAAGGVTGSTGKQWYLLAGPGDFAVIDCAFLDGTPSPIIEEGEVDFDRLGIAYRCYWGFGVAMLENRGGVLMKGEA